MNDSKVFESALQSFKDCVRFWAVNSSNVYDSAVNEPNFRYLLRLTFLEFRIFLRCRQLRAI